MSTNDVPGAVPENNDELHTGCWAEHADGSLILVLSTEDDKVYYDIYDMSKEPPLTYRDAMPVGDFMIAYSVESDKLPKTLKARTVPKEPWVWHDKTPFPMSRIVETFADGVQPPSALHVISAAERIKDALKLRAERLQRDTIIPARGAAQTIKDKIARAFGELRK